MTVIIVIIIYFVHKAQTDRTTKEYNTKAYQAKIAIKIIKLENVAIITMYCYLRLPDAIAFPT